MKAKQHLPYLILDVFSNEAYKGNPLAVVILEEDLALFQYENIAREFGYSETSFIRYSEREKVLHVRSFTPIGVEVGGAGHNLLGAVYAAVFKEWPIFNEQREAPFVLIKDDKIFLKTEGIGLEHPKISMRQKPATIKDSIPVDELAFALGLIANDLLLDKLQPTIVETEAIHLMVPVSDTAALYRAIPHKELLIQLSEKSGFEGFYCFTFTDDHTAHTLEARFFNPIIGIYEDSATGSAAGPLAGFLFHYQWFKQDTVYRILQGVKNNQPSTLNVEVSADAIWVSGDAVIVMEGMLYI